MPLDPRLLRISPRDNVAMAKGDLPAGAVLQLEDRSVELAENVAAGHKLAVAPIAAGGQVLKYGAAIGSALCDIQPGQRVHTHNLRSDYLPTFARGDAAPPADKE